MPCNYTYHDGKNCARSPRKAGYCYFHVPNEISLRNNGRHYLLRLLVLARKGDGDWRGFNLPSEIDVSNIEINCKINISETEIEKISLSSSKFHDEVIAKSCTFSEDLSLQSTHFEQNLVLDESVFLKRCDLNSIFVKRRLNALSCEFQSSFIMRGDIEHSAIFNNTTFHDKATFTFGRNITLIMNPGSVTVSGNAVSVTTGKPQLPLFKSIFRSLKKWAHDTYEMAVSMLTRIGKVLKNLALSGFSLIKKRYHKIRRKWPHERKEVKNFYLFSGEAQFENVTFENPRYVRFYGVDLRRARFRGTDLRDVSFVGNNWYQTTLGRAGLYEDVEQRNNPNYHDKTEKLPYLENTYRNIRISLENIKDFSNANDFFVGEMEAQRKQLPFFQEYLFSINALYRYVSNYGTSPLRCVFWFLFFVLYLP